MVGDRARSRSAAGDASTAASRVWRLLAYHKTAYLLVLPVVLWVALVTVFPTLYAVVHSLYRAEYARVVAFVGLGNYLAMVRDPDVLGNLWATAVFVFGSLAIAIPLALILAMALNRKLLFGGLFRSLLIVPWVVSEVATALIFLWLLNPQYGPMSYILVQLGVGRLSILGNPDWAMPALVFSNVWRTFPFAMVLFLAALQTVSSEIVDAAKVDGANRLQTFAHVTIPTIQNTIMNAVILLSMMYFRMVALVLVLTGGGPVGTTEVLALRTFREGFEFWNTGYGAALSVVVFFINMVMTFVYVRLLRREVFE